MCWDERAQAEWRLLPVTEDSAEWIMLALGVPQGSVLGPINVPLRCAGSSWGTVEPFLRWVSTLSEHFIRNQMARNRNSDDNVRAFVWWCVFACASFSLSAYRLASPEEQLVSRQGEVARLPPLDELPAHLLLLQFALDQRLSLLVHHWETNTTRQALSLTVNTAILSSLKTPATLIGCHLK